MIVVIEQVPWPLWVAWAIAVAVFVHRTVRLLDDRHPLVPFAAGILVGVLLASTVARAAALPRSAQVPAPAPPVGEGYEQGPRMGPDAPGRTAAAHPVVAMAPQPATRTQPAPEGTPVTAIPSPGHNLRGVASWVRASLGDRYLAARLPKGTTLRICGALGCVVRVVNDYGPSRRLHPDRIVDLSRHDFAHVCGDPVLLGTCPVRVRVLGGAAPTPPATDVR